MSDRFRVVPANQLPQPGKCLGCGNDQKPCLDFGLTVDFVGAVLLCEVCFNDAKTAWPETNVDMQKQIALAKVKFYETQIGRFRANLTTGVDSFLSACERYAAAGVFVSQIPTGGTFREPEGDVPDEFDFGEQPTFDGFFAKDT